MVAAAPDVSGPARIEHLLVALPGAAGRLPVLERLKREYAPVVLAVLVPAEDLTRCGWAQEIVKADNFIESTGGADDVDAASAAIDAWMADGKAEAKALAGVLCYDEFGLNLTANLCERYGLPGTRPSMLQTIRDKTRFRKVCNHIPDVLSAQSRPCTADLVENIINGTQPWSFPSILKPRCGAGSWYVQQVDTRAELAAAYPELVERLTGSTTFPEAITSAGYLLEEMIVGQEVDVDGWAENGRIVFAQVNDNRPVIWPSMSEVGGTYPTMLPDPLRLRIVAVAQKVISACASGQDRFHGAFHFEAIANDEGIFPIELNARVGGAECPACVEATTGHWLPARAAELALGRSITPAPAARHNVVVSVNLHLGAAGILTRLDSSSLTDAQQRRLDVVQIVLWGQGSVGRPYSPNQGSRSCLGWIACGGWDVQEARDNMREVVSLLKIELDCELVSAAEILNVAKLDEDVALSDVSTRSPC
eukprot:TRINITY_DN2654_c0_g3_i1.p1 TRINITY_DN2654_c0_g3~~TRINITY_DN2654_c0_g3_i1.p1  ORF type:complete len:479 (+),score=24.83 TRINITY_DN2654_c0_g3_i1:40-1476(+)